MRGVGRGKSLPGPHNAFFSPPGEFYNETEARLFLQLYDQTAEVVLNQFMEAAWNYVTNVTKTNREEMVWCCFLPHPSSPGSARGALGVWGTVPSAPCGELRGRGKSQVYVRRGP